MKTAKKFYFTAALTLCILAFNPNASHALVPIMGDMGNEGLGAFTGSLDYSFTNATTAELEFVLTNTSPLANGGFITAFVFNNPSDLISGISLSATDADFGLLNDNNAVNGAPFGQFDFGASTGGSFTGGGMPSKGIAVGDTETFTFSLTGTNLDTLVDQSFLDTLSVPPGDGEGLKNFVVRYRGFKDGGSDKVPINGNGNGNGGPTDPNPVPEPATMLLFGSGMVGAALKRRFKA